MSKRGNTNGLDPKALASSAQLFRLNTLGLIEIREKPGQPVPREPVTALLGELVREGLWAPGTRAGKR